MNKVFERYRKLNRGEYNYNNGNYQADSVSIDWMEVKKIINSEIELIKPKKGIDYFDGEDAIVINGKDGVTPEKGKDYYTEEDVTELVDKVYSKIKIPSPVKVDIVGIKNELRNYVRSLLADIDIEPEYVRDLLESLKGDNRIDAKAIKNIDKYAVTKVIGVGGGADLSGRVYFWGVYSIHPNVTADTGDEYYNNSEELLYKYINGNWVAISGGTIETDDNFVYEDGNNFIFEDGNNFTYET